MLWGLSHDWVTEGTSRAARLLLEKGQVLVVSRYGAMVVQGIDAPVRRRSMDVAGGLDTRDRRLTQVSRVRRKK